MGDTASRRNPAIAVAATFTAEPLQPGLRLILGEAGLPFDIAFAPYNQLFQELLSPGGLLATNAGGVNVILLRFEDFVRDQADPARAREALGRTGRELVDALAWHAGRAKEQTVLAVFPPSPAAAAALRPDLESASAALLEAVRAVSGIHVLAAGDVDALSSGERHDPQRDKLAHVPFTDDYFAALAVALGRKVHAVLVPAHKVLVLDCDNTLWHGVVGEDGVDGLTLPARCLAVQKYAVEQHAKGTLVCLASKNAERDVLDVFEKRKDMVLRLEHIVAHRINWDPKPASVAALASELNLGLDSFVFLDDNPVECAQMKAELPQVVTLPLPAGDDVGLFLSRLWTFDKLAVTSEDARRTSMYRENAARTKLEAASTDIGDFIASLGLVIDIAPPAEADWARVAQLTQRTNQFNFTTKRRNESEMRAAMKKGTVLLRVTVKDRFGDYGLVGVMIAAPQGDALAVDTLLLSCRVLGRGVEHAMLRTLGDIAKEKKLAAVALPYLPTPKNEPARAFAESVAAGLSSPREGGVVYRIPVDQACAIKHRPGQDPEAVIRARDADAAKAAADARGPAGPSAAVPRSDRYALLAGALGSGRAVLDALRGRRRRVRALPRAPEPATTETERRMLALWEELLGISGLGVEDDYAALGGTSLLAAQLFAEISRRFGTNLRLTEILEAPTVRALARRIEPRATERSGGLVELRKAGGRNLFLIHDGDGETLLYLNLARRMPEDFSVYGVEPLRLPGVPLAHTRIEDMAAHYVGAIRKRQPRGPYLLGGLCAGGVIAYEMSAQLRRAGELVGLVALMDAAGPGAERRKGRIAGERLGRMAQIFSDAKARDESFIRRTVFVMDAVVRKVVNTIVWEVSSWFRRGSVRARFRLLRALLKSGKSWPSFVKTLSIREIYDAAEARYTPPSGPGKGIVLVRAMAGQGADQPYREIYADPSLGWSTIAPGLSIVDVAGGHASMLREAHVDSLASALLRQVAGPEVPKTEALSRE